MDEISQIKNRSMCWFHGAVLVITVILAIPYYTKAHPYGVFDYATLPFHEAGHFVFMPFGHFIGALGGTLVQLGMPLGFGLYFLLARKDHFAAGICAFWLFTQCITMSVYMADARFMILPLFGGDEHDWNYLFGQMHLLHQSVEIARGIRTLATVGMTATIGALAWIVISEFRKSLSKEQ